MCEIARFVINLDPNSLNDLLWQRGTYPVPPDHRWPANFHADEKTP